MSLYERFFYVFFWQRTINLSCFVILSILELYHVILRFFTKDVVVVVVVVVAPDMTTDNVLINAAAVSSISCDDMRQGVPRFMLCRVILILCNDHYYYTMIVQQHRAYYGRR